MVVRTFGILLIGTLVEGWAHVWCSHTADRDAVRPAASTHAWTWPDSVTTSEKSSQEGMSVDMHRPALSTRSHAR